MATPKLHPPYFSARPLNHETLRRRCVQFEASSDQLPLLISDYIVANRRLQNTNKNLKPHGRNVVDLGLSVSNTDLEHDLWAFVKRHWGTCIDNSNLVKKYVLTDKTVDVGRAFSLVTSHFNAGLQKGRLHDHSVLALVGVLLQRNDYHSCFKLVDLTFNSTSMLRYRSHLLKRKFAACSGIFCGVALLQAILMPLVPFLIWAVDLFVIFGTSYGFTRILLEQAGRVSWRPHNSILHRYLHQHEYVAVNKIITHFEEHREVNVKNFHTLQVRQMTSLGIFDQNDYELHLPQSNLPAFTDTDENLDHLTSYCRSELGKRKMVWDGLKEERVFLDFWMSHGENFEWVEPDQDPAEIANFREHVPDSIALYDRHR